MAKIFQKTIQHFNILIQDKVGKFLLTNPIPYEAAQFPNEGLLRYLKSKNLITKEKYKLLRYHHKVSKEAKSLDILATFWVQTEQDSKTINNLIGKDLKKQSKEQIEQYKLLIDKKIMAGWKVFAWEGDNVVPNPK